MLDETPSLSVDRKAEAINPGHAKAWPASCVHECFEQLADRQPTATAVVTDEGILTYADLDRRADGLAHALIDLEVRPQEPVGVLADRSASLPQAFLAVLKAGAVYVPLVADLPPQRLANMAVQSGMRLVIALDGLVPPPELLETLAANAGSGCLHGVFRPEDLPPDTLDCQPIRPDRPGRSTDLAAILFTSGSTGQPKGVLIQHDACLNMGFGHIEAHGITPDDRILLSTSPGFILGFRELCLPLMAGAAYVPASRSLLDDPQRLLDTMSRHRVSIALFTPSYLRLLDGAVPDGLRCILTAGERPNPDDARHYARRLDYWNMHGATEVCGTICMLRVDPDGEGSLPSGRPFANMAVHLLDDDGNEVPPGEIGEIHVVGIGVSRGYLNQPELTGESFVETPFGRAYRSRDLARWNEQGMLEALGRADDMVKVSGQSVSLGEIERALLRHPDVSRVAAMQHVGRLVAFVESPRPERARGEDWHGFLIKVLPGYMISARVTVIPRMPISSAGKVDRQELLALADGDWSNCRRRREWRTAPGRAGTGVWPRSGRMCSMSVRSSGHGQFLLRGRRHQPPGDPVEPTPPGPWLPHHRAGHPGGADGRGLGPDACKVAGREPDAPRNRARMPPRRARRISGSPRNWSLPRRARRSRESCRCMDRYPTRNAGSKPGPIWSTVTRHCAPPFPSMRRAPSAGARKTAPHFQQGHFRQARNFSPTIAAPWPTHATS